MNRCRRGESNTRPTDYESVALPAELLRLVFLYYAKRYFSSSMDFLDVFCVCMVVCWLTWGGLFFIIMLLIANAEFIIMSKLKSHSGTKKRLSMTQSGKIKRSFAFKRHNLRKRSQDMKRSSRGRTIMNESDAKIIKKFFIPYGLN